MPPPTDAGSSPSQPCPSPGGGGGTLAGGLQMSADFPIGAKLQADKAGGGEGGSYGSPSVSRDSAFHFADILSLPGTPMSPRARPARSWADRRAADHRWIAGRADRAPANTSSLLAALIRPAILLTATNPRTGAVHRGTGGARL